MHLVSRALIATAIVASLGLASPLVSTASAHAIISLDGVSAVAGKSSTMTLEIQHGCLPAEPTVQVEAFVGAPWRRVKPAPVPGWSSSVTRQAKGGWHITWVNEGEPIPFGTATFFPITVAWPSAPGDYGMSVMQLCPDSSYYWNDAFVPATAMASSPPLTPRPEVTVVAIKGAPAPKKRPAGTTPTAQHRH